MSEDTEESLFERYKKLPLVNDEDEEDIKECEERLKDKEGAMTLEEVKKGLKVEH